MNRLRLPRPGARGLLLAAGAIALAASAVPAGEAYRYKDSSGNWVYSDRPPADHVAQPVALSAEAVSPHMVVEPRSTPQGITLVAVNQCRCPVEFGVKIQTPGVERTARRVLAAQSEAALVELPPTPGTGRIAYEYTYVIGDPGAAHAPREPYRAPFALAQSFRITQAPPDAITHVDAANRNAIDIAMPVGTPVHAAREGLVINAAHRFFRGGTEIEDVDQANFVQVLHDDGTSAIYAHLQMDTIQARPGQRVRRGEYIANSGNTGFSSAPHLHFVVLHNAGMHAESVPVTFAGPGGASVTPRTGQTLTAY